MLLLIIYFLQADEIICLIELFSADYALSLYSFEQQEVSEASLVIDMELIAISPNDLIGLLELNHAYGAVPGLLEWILLIKYQISCKFLLKFLQ